MARMPGPYTVMRTSRTRRTHEYYIYYYYLYNYIFVCTGTTCVHQYRIQRYGRLGVRTVWIHADVFVPIARTRAAFVTAAAENDENETGKRG